jgi:hypothetical protein
MASYNPAKCYTHTASHELVDAEGYEFEVEVTIDFDAYAAEPDSWDCPGHDAGVHILGVYAKRVDDGAAYELSDAEEAEVLEAVGDAALLDHAEPEERDWDAVRKERLEEPQLYD